MSERAGEYTGADGRTYRWVIDREDNTTGVEVWLCGSPRWAATYMRLSDKDAAEAALDELIEQERDDYKDAAQADRDAIGEYVLREQALLAEGRLLREALYYYRAGGDEADRAAMALDSSPLIAAEAERVRKLEKVADEMRLLEHSCWAQDEDDPPTYGDCLRRGCVRAIPIRPYACSVVAALAALDAKEAPDEQAL